MVAVAGAVCHSEEVVQSLADHPASIGTSALGMLIESLRQFTGYAECDLNVFGSGTHVCVTVL